MLSITVPDTEFFNEATEEFETVAGFTLDLEHSLVSLSKWESKFEKPFLSRESKTEAEISEYVRLMILNENYDPNVLLLLSVENWEAIHAYIDSKQSATTFGDMPSRTGRGEVITSEMIYYWMVAFNIPFECQYWHLNRLFALIRICNIKNSPEKKMSRAERAQWMRALNEKRRAETGSRG